MIKGELKTLSELWSKSSKYYEKINTEKESNSASLRKNILIYFKAKKVPFILSANVFQEILILNQLLEIS